MRSRDWLLGIAGVCVAAVGAALITQHEFGMQPCPWCVLQRVIFLAIAVVAVVGAFLPMAALRRAAMFVVALLAGCGAAAALWQHFVAAASASCDLTLAERIVSALKLDERLPAVFMATASCAEAKVKLFGLPYEAWSLLLFVLIGAVAVLRMIPRSRSGARATTR